MDEAFASVVEQPATTFLPARLQPAPRAGDLRVEHTGDDGRQSATGTVAVGRELESSVVAETTRKRTSPATASNASCSRASGGLAQGVFQREAAEDVTQRPRCDESLRVDLLVAGEQRAGAEPGRERRGRRDVVLCPLRNLGVDEVLDEIERRRRGRTSGGLESGACGRSPAKWYRQFLDTGELYYRGVSA